MLTKTHWQESLWVLMAVLLKIQLLSILCHVTLSSVHCKKIQSHIDNEFTQPTSIIGWFVEVH